MEIDKAKDVILKLYQKSLYISKCKPEEHPIRVVESSKSLIGINKNNVNEKLIDFCKAYIDEFSVNEISFDTEKIEIPIVVTFLDLELSLLDNDLDSSFRNIYFLTKVSDGKQILEFLLEFCIKYSSGSFLLVSSVLRMELFSGFKNVLPGLLMCVQFIIKDSLTKKIKKNSTNLNKILSQYTIDLSDLNIFLNLYRVYNEDITRKVKINPFIYNAIKENCSMEKRILKKNISDDQLLIGRMWISRYLNDLKYEDYDKNLILDLDACRGSLKNSDTIEEKEFIWSYLNKLI